MREREKKFVFVALCLILSITACERRGPASVVDSTVVQKNRRPQSTLDLIDGSQYLLNEVKNPTLFNTSTCSSYLSGWTEKLFGLPAKYFVPTSQSEIDALKSAGPKVLQTLFDLRLALRDRLKEFESKGTVSNECVESVREGFRYSRTAEEMLTEWLQSQGVLGLEEPENLGGGFPHTILNSKFQNVELKAGDLLLIRGKATVSSMIARIGNQEGQFSHLAVVAQDQQGKLHIAEALIQYGAIITPVDEWRKDRDARIVLLRHPDAELAKNAARGIYDFIAPRFKARNNIHYDFQMNDDDESAVFCAEVASIAYRHASKDAVKLPLHRTSASKFKGTGFLENFGIRRDSFFAPSDIEVDTRFDVVGEFKHWPFLRKVRMQDATMASIYDWMIKRGDRFHGDAWLTGKAFFAKLLRQFGLFKEKLPAYMPLKAVHTTLQFEAVAQGLFDNLSAQEEEFFRVNGYTHSFRELLATNEEMRKKDCREWVRQRGGLGYGTDAPPEKIIFSSLFHNEKSCD